MPEELDYFTEVTSETFLHFRDIAICNALLNGRSKWMYRKDDHGECYIEVVRRDFYTDSVDIRLSSLT